MGLVAEHESVCVCVGGGVGNEVSVDQCYEWQSDKEMLRSRAK